MRTDTLESPPRSMGTQPPEESSRVITCALTRTNESLLQIGTEKKQQKQKTKPDQTPI